MVELFFFIIIQQRLDLNLRSLGQQAKKYAMSKRLTTINQSMFICREHNVESVDIMIIIKYHDKKIY